MLGLVERFANACDKSMVPRRFTAKGASQSSALISMKRLNGTMPCAFTRMSMPPKASTAVETMRSAAPSAVMSAAHVRTVAPEAPAVDAASASAAAQTRWR